MNLLHGKNEFEIFKSYYNKQARNLCSTFAVKFDKDDEKSTKIISEFRKNYEKNEKSFNIFLLQCTNALMYAIYNGRAYATALIERSKLFFENHMYKESLIDIDLCHEESCPVEEKPELYIRKAKCLFEMRKMKESYEAITDLHNFLNTCTVIPNHVKRKYLQEIELIMKSNMPIEVPPFQISLPGVPKIKEVHPLNRSASSSIKFICNKTSETDYVAARDIPCGEVLFVEEAYSIGFVNPIIDWYTPIYYCDYCMNQTVNCIPCRNCIYIFYCSENCRAKSWSEYHQWECVIINASVLLNGMILSIRTLIKAVRDGAIHHIVSKKTIKQGKNEHPYLNVYSLFIDFAKLCTEYKTELELCCINAIFMVELLKKSNYISHVTSELHNKYSLEEVTDIVGGILLRHDVQTYQRSLSIYCFPLSLPQIENKIVVRHYLSMNGYNAFCPTVSELPHSCMPNTCINFEGLNAVVRASKNIKAGERIYRFASDITPKMSLEKRKNRLKKFMIVCKCEACEDITKNCEIYNCYKCVSCKGEVLIREDLETTVADCKKCGYKNDISLILTEIKRYKSVKASKDLSQTLSYLESIKKIAQPNHECLHSVYKDILMLSAEDVKLNFVNEQNIIMAQVKCTAKISKFMKTLKDFKNCSQTRYSNLVPHEYATDLIIICRAYWTFLNTNGKQFRKEDAQTLLDIFSPIFEETKKICAFMCPPVLPLFEAMEIFLLKFRINNIYLK